MLFRSLTTFLRYPRRVLGLLAALLLLPALQACTSQGPARQALYVSCSRGQRVLVYEIDRATGQLTEVQQLEVPGQSGPLAMSSDGQAFYAGLREPTSILPMTRDTATGELTALEPTEIADFPVYLDVDANDRFLLSASYGPGTVTSFRINDDRTILADPVQTTNTARTAHCCLIDPSNRYVFVPHTEPNEIYQFRFDATTGRLILNNPVSIMGGGSSQVVAGPRHYTYHPTLDVVYFVNELNSSVGSHLLNTSAGTLQRFNEISTLPEGWTGSNTCADIHVTPDGRFLYASNRGHNSIVAYSLNSLGMPTLIDWFETEEVPRSFAIDLTGQYLYAAGLRTNKLDAFAIDPETGRLNRIGTYDTPEGPIWVAPAALD